MTAKEQMKKAKEFAKKWEGRGYEKGESQPFWLSLLSDVFGVEDVGEFIKFEEKVRLEHTNFIDARIKETEVLIEQKSINTDLDAKIKQSDGRERTPYGQVRDYISGLPRSQHPKWVVISNFKEFRVHDMENPYGEPEIIKLCDLEKEYYRLNFLVNKKDEHITKEMEISIAAGEIVGLLYDAFYKEYRQPISEENLNNLNILCVRLVFCLYAEDSGIFGRKNMFYEYLSRFKSGETRNALIRLFKILDTKIGDRDEYLEDYLAEFPFVNGGLFSGDIVIPQINDKIRDLILNKASENFDWSGISPTIFGAVFESTLNPQTRRSGGMHYTSIENIHKVIDPLFLDNLKIEFEGIKSLKTASIKKSKLENFQNKLSNLTFFDPACGSGNFLTETYLSIRRLENEVLKILLGNQINFNIDEYSPIKVSISQFYGIEINDFAVTVAKTALWIAESQMMKETEEIIHTDLDFLPLKTNAYIVEGNALKIDWESVVDKKNLNYIIGNPPFVGHQYRTTSQADEVLDIFNGLKGCGKLDYVACWFKKASSFMKNTKIETAFVSTNSICQGESVSLLWKNLFDEGIKINFAYTTFKWTSESNNKANVLCVIVGFSMFDRDTKLIFGDGMYKEVKNINAYLNEGASVFIENRSKSINENLAKVSRGSQPTDDGYLLISKEEKEILLKKYPELEKVIKAFVGGRELINDTEYTRYCFWFEEESPSQFMYIKELVERFNRVREARLNSPTLQTIKSADKPFLFSQIRQPKSNYLIIPETSSSNRKYIPIGFMNKETISSNANILVHDATIYDFGILTSNVHNAWMRVIAGRLKNDYRYSPSVYYNFPFPDITDRERKEIEKTAQMILDARALYKDKSLADMYGKDTMYLFPELVKAHKQNDIAVMNAYGMDKNMDESSIVAHLFDLYEEKTQNKLSPACN
jgi:hypothetical protein